MNIARLVEDNVREFGEYLAIVWVPDPQTEHHITNAEMHRQTKKLANGLKRLGVEQGDRVMVLTPTCPEILASFQAIPRIGAVVVPTLFLLAPQEIRYIVEDCEPRVIITSAELLGTATQASEGVRSIQSIVVIDDELPGTVSYKKLVEDSSEDCELVETKDDDLAVLIYTAGTTGKPKGVMLTHMNLYSNARDTLAHGITPGEDPRDDINLHLLPLSHSYGLTMTHIAYMSGAKNVLMPRFDGEEAMRLIEKHKVTTMAGVPAMFYYMLQLEGAEKRYDLGSIKSWPSGSAPFPVEPMNEFLRRFGGAVLEGYGLSEASPIVSAHSRVMEKKPGSVGKEIPNVETRIVDEDDNELPTGEVGQLLVRGPNVMKGYFKMPEETARTLRNGWLHTGDMARKDEDGFLYIVERKKDLIIRGGENIYPREVEEVLWQHPKVQEAAIIGVPDPVMGEEIKAFVVLKAGEQATAEEIVSFCRERLAKFKAPKMVAFVDALPRSLIGKVLRRELRENAPS